MKAISLFAGAGISDWGFHLAGIDVLAQVEIDKQTNAVRKRHFPSVAHFEDIRSFDATQFLGRVGCVFGGAPCQDYSVAGKRGGLAGDKGALWWEFHRVVRECRPQFVVLENVPGILSSGGGRDFGTIVESLVELGYGVCWRVLDLQFFGIPQRRRRVFVVGSLGDGRAAQVLFEPESLHRHPAEGRSAGEGDTQSVARCLRGRSNLGGAHAEDLDTYIPEVSRALVGTGNDCDPDVTTYIASTLNGSGAGTERPAGNANELGFCVVEPICIKGAAIGREPQNGPQRGEFLEGQSCTLNASEVHGVAEPAAVAFSCKDLIGLQKLEGGGGVRVRRLTPL